MNSTEVLGLEHDQAIEVVKETPAKVMIVVARRILPADTEEGLGEQLVRWTAGHAAKHIIYTDILQ